MNKKLRNAIFLIWGIIFLAALLLYLFNPDQFFRLFSYQGPGSPFVNTPQG